MTDAEIITQLQFSVAWFKTGVLTGAKLTQIVAEYRSAAAQPEEWRWQVYEDYLKTQGLLSPEQCVQLYELGKNDPDETTSLMMMMEIVRRPECPPVLIERAL